MSDFWIKTTESGQQQGPFAARQVKQLATTGQLKPDHLVSSDDCATWYPARKIANLEFGALVLETEERLEVSPPPGQPVRKRSAAKNASLGSANRTTSIPDGSPVPLGTETVQNGPSGLGGWLIFPAIGLVIMPFSVGAILLQIHVPIFTDGAWEILTTPGSDQYHPLWAGLIIFEVLGNLGFIIADIALAILFFSKSRLFPKTYIAFLLINLCFILLDAWLGSFVITDAPMFDPDTTKELVRSLAGVVIWVPYMLVSKRVRNTFV